MAQLSERSLSAPHDFAPSWPTLRPDSAAQCPASADDETVVPVLPAYSSVSHDPFSQTHSHLARHHLQLQAFLADWCNKHEALMDRMHEHHRHVINVPDTPQSHVEFSGSAEHDAMTHVSTATSIGKFHTLRTTLNMANVKGDLQRHVKKQTDRSSGKRTPPEKSTLVWWCEKVEECMYFQHFCSLVILANAVCLTITTEQDVRSIGGDGGNQRNVWGFEVAFCCFYTGELVIRMTALRTTFFSGRDMSWNLFDLVLVATALQEQLGDALSVGEGQNMSYLRIVRLLKMLKVLRMVRLMRAFRELRLVLDSILGSMKAMLWSVALILLISFMFGVCFVQAITELLAEDGEPCPASGGGRTHWLACRYWGSVTEAMLSLFKASTGGSDWAELAEPLHAAGLHYYAIFCFYVGFFLFVVMNSLTSLFLDSMLQQAQKDDETLIQEQMARKHEYMKKIVKVYRQMDQDENGDVSYEEFMQHVDDKCMVAFAASLEIEPAALEQFFSILSAKGKRTVDLENFVVGCIKLRGAAKSMDVMDCIMHQRQLQDEFVRFMASCQESFRDLRLCVEQRQRLPPLLPGAGAVSRPRSPSRSGAAEAMDEPAAAAAAAAARERGRLRL